MNKLFVTKYITLLNNILTHQLCCFPQKREIQLNNNEEEVEVKNNNSNLCEEKNELVNSTKSRSKLSKSEETNNQVNNAVNKENRNSIINECQNADGSGNNPNYFENKAVSETQSALNNNNNIQSSNLSMNKIMQQNDHNSNSNLNNNGNFNTNNSKQDSYHNANNSGNVNYSSGINNKSGGQQAHNAGKKDDTSIVDITSASRVINDEDVKNAPMLSIEVFLFLYCKLNLEYLPFLIINNKNDTKLFFAKKILINMFFYFINRKPQGIF